MNNPVKDAILQFKPKSGDERSWLLLNTYYLACGDNPDETSDIRAITKQQADIFKTAYESNFPKHDFRIVKQEYEDYK